MSWSRLDYRSMLIPKRFAEIGYTLMVASGKGGVGKSLISASTALIEASRGVKAGLLDLDLHGPSSAAILGVTGVPAEGEDGLIPLEKMGVKVMSVEFFAEEKPVPVGGAGKRELIRELLALTDWGKLDLLVVDLPPGTGDEMLAAIELIPERRGCILVTTPSALSARVAFRAGRLLKDMKVDVLGVLENMSAFSMRGEEVKPFGEGAAEELSRRLQVQLLGRLPLDPEASLAADLGKPEKLLQTRFAEALSEILDRTLSLALG